MLALLLAGCDTQPAAEPESNAATPAPAAEAPPNTAAASPSAQATPALAIEGEGLRLVDRASGSARPIPFGTAHPAVIAELAARGQPEINKLEECGAGPLDAASWRDGLTLYFQDAKFVGWAVGRQDGDAPATPAGITIGSTRAELESAYKTTVQESSLGTEFEAGTLFGILDGKGAKARVSNLWAGTSCNMR